MAIIWFVGMSLFPHNQVTCEKKGRLLDPTLFHEREEPQRQKVRHQIIAEDIREVFKKSKWKFKIAFAMKWGGVETGLECHIPILKNDIC